MKRSDHREHLKDATIVRVVLPYALFAGLWILLSDRLLEAMVRDSASFARISIYKGWAFVAVTSVLLVFLLRVQLRERRKSFAMLEDRVAERTRELSEARRFTEALLENIPNPVCWKDAQLRYLGCNRSFERAFGVRREEISGKTLLELNGSPEEEHMARHADLRRVLEQSGTLQRERLMLHADGSRHHTLLLVSSYCHRDGTPAGVVEAFTDISALKQTEAELAIAKDRAEAADRLKSAFLATMSHELRTPLNSIIGFTGILLRGLAGPLNEEQAKQLGMVQGSARHLLALINDVLDISKIEAGELTVVFETFRPRDVLEKAIEAMRPLAEAKGLSLAFDIHAGLSEMHSDARRIGQILLNLINNAVKFTAHGSVTVRARAEAGQLVCTITDTGIGIRPEHMDLLFQPFQQIDSGLTRNHEGTGLGLAISRRLAGLLGGEIRAESRWGEGSTFTLSLPLHAGPDGGAGIPGQPLSNVSPP